MTSSVKTVHLCRGDLTTLSSNDVKSVDKDGNDYGDYRITWHKNKTSETAIHIVQNGTKADDLDVAWKDADENGTMYILLVHDNFENPNNTRKCDMSDTVIIYADPIPDVPSVKIPAFCEGLASESDDVKTYISQLSASLTGYKETIEYDGNQTTTFADLINVLDALPANATTVFSIYLQDVDTKEQRLNGSEDGDSDGR